MPAPVHRWARRGSRAAALLLSVVLAGCAGPPPTSAAAVPPTPPGEARVWFYRDYEPYVTLSRPYVRLNGQIVGISEPGGAFYRDVRPGTYKATVDTYGRDINQFVTVSLAVGQTIYIKVEALRDWASGGGGRGGDWRRDTFYARLIPPAFGAAAVVRTAYYGGS